MDVYGVRSVLMEAVDGFQPKEDVEDPLWGLRYGKAPTSPESFDKEEPSREVDVKVTSLFRDK